MSTKETEPETTLDAWLEYERRKSELPPDLTPGEYEDAVQEIARGLDL